MKQTLLFAELARRGVELRLAGDDLLCIAADDALSTELLASIRNMKPAIVEWLRRRESLPGREFVQPLGEGEEVPLSFNQQRLWFLEQLNPGQCGYVMIRAFRVTGSVDPRALQNALTMVASRHKILSTRILVEDEIPLQVIDPSPRVELRHIETPGLSDAEWQAEIERLAAEAGRTPFDITEETLVRGYLLSRSATEHVLLLTLHHIAADDWSWTIFLNEFVAAYSAASSGKELTLPELPISYADYAAYQRASLDSDRVRKQVAYWKEKLGGVLPTLDFPLDKPRPKQQTDRGARARFSIPRKHREALQRMAVHEGATLFMALLAVYKLLLHRYTGQEDIIVGTPIANRNLIETGPLIGFFANTIVIRSTVEGEQSFLSLLRNIRQICLEAYENQDVPFEHIVEIVNPSRDLSRPPIFDTQFALRNVPRETVAIPGLDIEELDVDPRTSKFDMFFFMRDEGEELSLSIEYNTDLFEAETIDRLGRCYTRLVENVVSHGEDPVARIPFLGAEDRALQLYTWNETARAYPLDTTLHELVERQVESVPDKVAVRFGDRTLSYRELNERADSIATELSRRGIRRGALVGVFVERSEHMVSALLGILKSGAAYVPLDPYYPRDRIAYIVENARIAAIVTDEQHQSEAVELHELILRCDGTPADAATPTVPGSAGHSPELAYVIYTSGSTGQPKGVAVTHRNVVNFIHSMAESPGFASSESLLAVTTLSFDISILEVFLPLTRGGTLHVLSRDGSLDASAISTLIDEHDISVMQATPATWELLLASGWKGSDKLRILCGGEAFPRQLADRLLEVVPEVWNMYGPTETTIWSSIARVEPSPRAVPIGRPIANTTMYVLDRYLKPVPIGAVGELHIGGTGVSRGYLHRDDLTGERFVPDPFSDQPESRLYKTGDLARYRTDGMLECLGRIDTQVKIRGFRVELGEIEAALESHDDVSQAIVTAVQSARKDGFDALVAHYVLSNPRVTTHTELRAHLRRALPEYMIPQYYSELEEFPLTPNNKIDRMALAHFRPPSQELDVPRPETESEIWLSRLWQDILGVREVGRYALFFEVGGHSLLAAQMVARVEKERKVRIPLRAVIVSTLSEIATTYLDEHAEPKKRSIVRRLLEKVF